MSEASDMTEQTEGAEPPSEFHYPRLNRLRVHDWRTGDGSWSASYWRPNGTSVVSGCESRAEALEALRRFVGMKVEEIDGTFVEVPRKRRWWWPR